MGKHTKVDFMALGETATSAKRGSQAAFEPGDRAFDLDALAVLAAMKAPVHLPSVLGLGPAPATPAVQVNNAAADPQGLTGQDMITLGVVSGVGHHAIQREACLGLAQDRGKEGSFLARTVGDDHIDEQMSGVMTSQRQFGPVAEGVAFLARPPRVVARARRGVEAGRIDAGLGTRFEELLAACFDKYLVHKLLVRTFFKRRCCAL